MKVALSFPTVVFTFLLVVCVLWWLASMVLGGLDSDVDVEGGEGLADQLGLTAMPLPLALSILALGGWLTSALLHGLVGDSARSLAIGASIGVFAGAIVVGLGLVKLLSGPVGTLFATEPAPKRRQAVGSICKVRTLEVSERSGDAEVITGPIKGSVVAVRAADGRFHRGDLALIVDYDERTEHFVIDEVDDLVTPD